MMNLNYLCNFCYIKYGLSLKFERYYFCRGQKEDTCMAMTYEVDLHGHDRRQENHLYYEMRTRHSSRFSLS